MQSHLHRVTSNVARALIEHAQLIPKIRYTVRCKRGGKQPTSLRTYFPRSIWSVVQFWTPSPVTQRRGESAVAVS